MKQKKRKKTAIKAKQKKIFYFADQNKAKKNWDYTKRFENDIAAVDAVWEQPTHGRRLIRYDDDVKDERRQRQRQRQ